MDKNPDWDRLARHVRQARGLRSQKDIARQGGPSDETISKIEAGQWKPRRGVKATLDKLDTGLEWAPGSAQNILNGGDPTPLSPLGAALAGLIPTHAPGPQDEYFDRAEGLLQHSRLATQRGDYYTAIHVLEGAQSTVELLIDRVTDMAIDQQQQDGEGDDLEAETQSDASSQVDEGQEVDIAWGDRVAAREEADKPE